MNPWELYGAPPEQPAQNPWEMYAPEAPKNPEEKNFFQRMGDNIDKRAQMAQEIQARTNSGQQNPIHGGFQSAGKVGMGLINDLAGEAVVSAGRGIANISPEPVKQFGRDFMDTPIVNGTQELIGKAAGAYGRFAEKNPIIAADIESATNLGSALLPTGKGAVGTVMVESGENALKSTGKAVANTVDNALTPRYAPQNVTSETLRKVSSNTFKAATAKGGELAPEFRAGWLDDVAREAIPVSPEGMALSKNAPIRGFMEIMDEFRGKPLTFQAAQDIDQRLTQMIDNYVDPMTGKITAEGTDLVKAQEILRDKIDNAPDNLFVGTREGFELSKQARKDWARSYRVRDIETIINRAMMTQNPQSSLQTSFRNLALNPKRMRGFDKQQQKIIRQLAYNKGMTIDTMRTLGSRLIPIMGASQGPAGFLAGQAVSYAARGAGDAVKIARAEKLAKMVAGAPKGKKLTMKEIMALPPEQARWYLDGGVVPEAAKVAAPVAKEVIEETKLLPAPNREFIVSPTGAARRQTDDEIVRASAGRARDAELGLTPDVRKAISKIELQKKFGPVWEQIDAANQTRIQGEIAAAWKQNKTPLEDIINQAKVNAEELYAAKGEKPFGNALSEALLGAKKARK